MLGRKRIRNNYKKNSAAKRQAKKAEYVMVFLKLVTAIAVLLLISSAFIFSHDFLTQCDYFNAESLNVKGAHRISERQVVKQTQITRGMNILSVNLETVRERLLANPWIAEAEVSRELPDGIHIRIKEHHPLAVLDLGRKYLINTKGEIFKKMSASDPGNMPIVSGLEFSDINMPGKPHSVEFESVMDVLRLGQQSESILPNRSIKRIHVDKEIGLTLFTPDRKSGRVKVIKLGYHNYRNKYKRFENVSLYLKKQERFPDFEMIDLNSSDRIVISPVRTQTSPGDQKEVKIAKT